MGIKLKTSSKVCPIIVKESPINIVNKKEWINNTRCIIIDRNST